jgi:hypothetical protein
MLPRKTAYNKLKILVEAGEIYNET